MATTDFIAPVYQQLIEASPFCAFATVGPEGTDCTPRGYGPGFVRVIDEHTLEMPDRKGNNRLDSLRNIVADGRCSILFLIPNRIDSMRVNGREPETWRSVDHLPTPGQISNSFKDFEMDVAAYDANYEPGLRENLL